MRRPLKFWFMQLFLSIKYSLLSRCRSVSVSVSYFWRVGCVYWRLTGKHYSREHIDVVFRRWFAMRGRTLDRQITELRKHNSRAKWRVIAKLSKQAGVPQHVAREFIERKYNLD